MIHLRNQRLQNLKRRYPLFLDDAKKKDDLPKWLEQYIRIFKSRTSLLACWKQGTSPTTWNWTSNGVAVIYIRSQRSPMEPRKSSKYRLRFVCIFRSFLVVLVQNSNGGTLEHLLNIPACFGAAFYIITCGDRLCHWNSLKRNTIVISRVILKTKEVWGLTRSNHKRCHQEISGNLGTTFVRCVPQPQVESSPLTMWLTWSLLMLSLSSDTWPGTVR